MSELIPPSIRRGSKATVDGFHGVTFSLDPARDDVPASPPREDLSFHDFVFDRCALQPENAMTPQEARPGESAGCPKFGERGCSFDAQGRMHQRPETLTSDDLEPFTTGAAMRAKLGLSSIDLLHREF